MLRAIGLPEMIVIGVVFILLFGGKKFGELGKGVGESIREFKKATFHAKEAKEEVEKL
jgi:sec-independent protein translocase protein TatA